MEQPTEDAASLGGESEEAYIEPLLLRTGQEERVIPKGLKGEWFLGWMKNVVCHSQSMKGVAVTKPAATGSSP